MTLEEKAKFIEENKNQNYLFIAPRFVKSGVKLVDNYEKLTLYENMAENTAQFAKKTIVDLISRAIHGDREAKAYLNFNLIFCGDFSALKNRKGSVIDFIMNNKEKIVAVYKYVKSTEQREFFVGFTHYETIYNYGYLYLDFAKLLEEFTKNNVNYVIDTTEDRYVPGVLKDETVTKFVISYSPKKEIVNEEGPKLKKQKKEI